MKTVSRLTKRTTRCDGSDPLNIRLWIKEIDLIVPEVGVHGVVEIAAETVAGSFRAELERFVQAQVQAHGINRHQVPWEAIKQHLTEAFLTTDEKENARKELDGMKQGTYEMEASYNRRFRDLITIAYPPGGRNVDQHQTMIKYLAKGLRSDDVAKELVRHRPRYQDIEGAMRAVLDIVGKNDDYERLGRIEEAMDVNVVKVPVNKPSNNDNTTDINKLAREVTKMGRQMDRMIAEQNRPRGPTRIPRSDLPNWRGDQPRCFRCNKYGHKMNECHGSTGNGNGRAAPRS